MPLSSGRWISNKVYSYPTAGTIPKWRPLKIIPVYRNRGT